ncbi:hypothetical protein FQZ97_988110 [compost metagenome]
MTAHLGDPHIETGTDQMRAQAEPLGRVPETAIREAAVHQDDRHASRAFTAEAAQAGQHQLDAGIRAVVGLQAIDVLGQVATEVRAHQRNGKEIATALHDFRLHKKGRVPNPPFWSFD